MGTIARGATRLLIAALVAFVGLTSTGRRAWAQLLDLPTVTIGVDDYAGIPVHELDNAQREVSRWYAAINVEVTWLATRRLTHLSVETPQPIRPETPDLTVIVLNPYMTDRTALAPEVVGCAPGTTTERGRIAYVLYERLRRLASAGAASDDVDLLGIVVAHEIGHLLLPFGSHSETGIMRGHWEVEELRRLDGRTLSFTPSQGEQIRRRLSVGKSSD